MIADVFLGTALALVLVVGRLLGFTPWEFGLVAIGSVVFVVGKKALDRIGAKR